MPTRKPATKGTSTRTATNTAKRSNKNTRATRVALIGFGTVGSSVVRVLAAQKFADIELTHIFNRNIARKQILPAAKLVPATTKWTENIDDLLNSKPSRTKSPSSPPTSSSSLTAAQRLPSSRKRTRSSSSTVRPSPAVFPSSPASSRVSAAKRCSASPAS